MLQLEAVEVSYGGAHALRGVALQVGPGEIVALLGANGAGKSTILRAISGIVPLSAGAIRWGDRRIDGLPADQIVRLGIVHVPEGRQIFPELTVEENLLIGSYARSDRTLVKREIAAVFDRFPPLARRRKQPGATLSGGEQQMLAIARAMLAAPRLLLLDEPSLGLAPKPVQDVLRVIHDLNREGVTVLLVEQNAHLALALAHRAYVLENGRVVLAGSAADLRVDPAVQRSYLGPVAPE